MSPPSSPEEEAPSSPEEQEHPSSRAMSPVAATREVPNESDRIQVEAKDVRLSDMPPVTLDVTNVNTEIDDIAELNIVEDLDNRPSKKAKISELGVLEPKPMSASSPNSECFESIVPESDNQIDRDPLASPPSPSSSTLSPGLLLLS